MTGSRPVVGWLVVLVLLVAAGCAEQALPADSAPPPQVEGGPSASAGGQQPPASPPAPATAPRRLSYVFPVRGRTSYSRAHHDYPATDMFARCRTRTVAP
nr:hypothetical protein [Actinomycetota bacterium]